jgi:hypothetical protein
MNQSLIALEPGSAMINRVEVFLAQARTAIAALLFATLELADARL